jgi:hypothetical protein
MENWLVKQVQSEVVPTRGRPKKVKRGPPPANNQNKVDLQSKIKLTAGDQRPLKVVEFQKYMQLNKLRLKRGEKMNLANLLKCVRKFVGGEEEAYPPMRIAGLRDKITNHRLKNALILIRNRIEEIKGFPTIYGFMGRI